MMLNPPDQDREGFPIVQHGRHHREPLHGAADPVARSSAALTANQLDNLVQDRETFSRYASP
jgi:hypothetical protein